MRFLTSSQRENTPEKDLAPKRFESQSERIVFVTGGFASVGGVETFTHSLVVALRGRHITVEVICWGAQNQFLKEMEAAGAKVRRNGFRWGCRWDVPDRILLLFQRRHLRHVRLVVFPKLLSSKFHLAVGRMKPVTGGYPQTILITPYRPAEIWPTASPDLKLLDSFDAIVTQSAAFEEDLRNLGYRGPVAQLPYIPPVCDRVAPSPLHPVRIGFLGRLVPDKRPDYLLAIFAVISRLGDFRLEVFGDGPLMRPSQALSWELGLSSKITFHGSVGRAQIGAAIDSCALFTFTSRTEGQCLAAVEILSRGRPIVATPVGMFPELFADGRLGRVGPADDPKRFAEIVLEVAGELGSPRFAPQTVQNIYSERFLRSSVIEGYARLFQSRWPPEPKAW